MDLNDTTILSLHHHFAIMRDIKYRERNVEDDIRAILHIQSDPTGTTDDTIVIPEKPVYPIIVWSKDSTHFNPNHVKIDEVDSYIRECMFWPIQTDSLCHNCCHSFDTIPVPLPYSFDKLRNIYKCRGNFCSWQCAKAYSQDTVSHTGRGSVNTNIALLAYRLWVKYILANEMSVNSSLHDYARYSIIPADNKSCLKIFGGKQTIEEYRKGFFGIVPPKDALEGKPFLSVKSRLYLPFSNTDKRLESEAVSTNINPNNTMNTIGTSVAHKHANEFCEKLNRAKKENVSIKRKRPDSTKNTLLSSMGVKVLKKR